MGEKYFVIIYLYWLISYYTYTYYFWRGALRDFFMIKKLVAVGDSGTLDT